MDKISVIICCYNTADTLDRCFDSLKKQTYGFDNLECIFVDDGSTDNGDTLCKLQSFERMNEDNVIVVACEENGRLGTASNIGLMYASGKYLQFLDADDELVDSALEDLHKLAEDNQADIVQYCHTLIMGDIKQVNPPRKKGLFVIETDEQRIPFLNSSLVTYGRTNKFYRLDFVKEVGSSFAEHLVYEEPKFVYPLFLYAKRVLIIDTGYYLYYLHDNSIVTSQAGSNLLDHPNVQLQLLQDCMRRTDVYQRFRDVIALYFLWSYYCETIMFAGEYKGARLPLEYFSEMQEICRKLFPDWRKNPFIQELDDKTRALFDSIERRFLSQEELEGFIQMIIREC